MTATDDVRAEREELCDWPDCGCEGDEVCRLAQHVLMEEKRADRATARAERAEAEVARLREALEWALDNAATSDHPHYPYREDGRWVFPYLVSGTPLGGGVGHASFGSALEAVQQAAALQPRSPGGAVVSAPATDDVRAAREGLVARLREVNCCAYACIFDDAADLIETQAAEIKRLTEAVEARSACAAACIDESEARAARAEAERDTLAAECASLREALDAAVNELMAHEPGDSRAVSDLAVSLAAVACDCANDEAWQIARAALQPRSPSHG